MARSKRKTAEKEPAAGGPFRGPLPHPRVEVRGKHTQRHPWLMKGQLAGWDKEVVVGEPVCFLDAGGYWVGSGFFQPRSRVQGRILAFEPGACIDIDWLRAAIERAVELRRLWGVPDACNAYRVINSEGDGLSGLTVDRYGDVLVVQIRSLGFARWRKPLAGILRDVLGSELELLWVTEESSARIEGIQLPIRTLPARTIEEYGVRFEVDFQDGHKTGFFLDQRENRQLVAELSRGRHLLDVCCYTGGFGISAAVNGMPASVTGVDLDEKALEVARRNAALNEVEVDFVHADAFRFLKDLRDTQHRFDAIVLDPPKFARRKSELQRAEQTLIDMNRHALNASKPNSLLVTCSCAGLISNERFCDLVRLAARRANRQLQIVEIRGPGPDHPLSIDFPEGRYLHVLIAWVRTLA